MSRIVRLPKEGTSRIEIKKSIFIGHCLPVSSADEAADFVRNERKLYPDARHVCHAWIIGEDKMNRKTSDDGEPSGTAGMPIAEVLESNDISDAVVSVTRYFGGILLGKGGLMRAYREAALEAVRASSPIIMIRGVRLSVTCDYSFLEKLSRKAESSGWNIKDINYTDNVTLIIEVPSDDEQSCRLFLTENSAGRIVPSGREEVLIAGAKADIN